MDAAVITKRISFETALGVFNVDARVEPSIHSVTEVTLNEAIPTEVLPEGMSVKRRRAALLFVESACQLRRVSFSCSLNSPVSGGSCSGQGLEAIEWEDSGSLVVVGTEDADFLNQRLPFLRLKQDEAIVTYSPSSITVSLENIAPKQQLSLHFVIAENPNPEPAECSAWYAVDCLHTSLRQAAPSS